MVWVKLRLKDSSVNVVIINGPRVKMKCLKSVRNVRVRIGTLDESPGRH
jgi:hypothetical protein